MDLADALAYLDRHIDLERSTAVAGRLEGLSLDRMRALCTVLGDPERAQPALHLTGTNGKGSTARMISSLLIAHELSVGTYTSPHLERVNERITRNLEPIDDDALAALISEVATFEPLAAVEPSYFELLTAAAFTWFAQLPVDVAVVEVGLLGRFDATNVVDGSVAVLTNVGHDHTDFQGDWRHRIADEKAGIVKPGSTFVLGETDQALRPVFEAAGAARLLVRDEDFECIARRPAVGGQVIDVRTPFGAVDDVYLPVHGSHQADNAVLALVAVEWFFERALPPDVVADGFGSLTLPGRFEVVHRRPLVILDGAHNRDGALAAAETLAVELDIAGRRIVVLGVLAGRDPLELVSALGLDHDDRVLTCMPDSPRAVDAGELAALLSSAGLDAEPAGEPAAALDSAMATATDDDLVLVTGSLYTVGAARAACRARGLLPSPPP